jgi:hypothetical protein
MLIGPFVFVHVPKTGGQTVRYAVQRSMTPNWYFRDIADHEALSSLTAEEQARPVIWCVRNPWDWHVSLYCYALQTWTFRLAGFRHPPEQWQPHSIFFDKILKQTRSFSGFVRLAINEWSEAHFMNKICRNSAGHIPSEPVRCENLREGIIERIQTLFPDRAPPRLYPQNHAPTQPLGT